MKRDGMMTLQRFQHSQLLHINEAVAMAEERRARGQEAASCCHPRARFTPGFERGLNTIDQRLPGVGNRI